MQTEYGTLLANTLSQLKQDFFANNPSRPFVTLSFAQSLDGCIAANRGERLSLSSAQSLKLTHMIRAWHDAILVGIGTVLSDDPLLTVRLTTGDNPQRIILDSKLRIPLTARVLDTTDAATLIVTGKSPHHPEKKDFLRKQGVSCFSVEEDEPCLALPETLQKLFSKGVNTLMVEGGAAVISSFLQKHLVDFLIITIAPVMVGLPQSPRYCVDQGAMPFINDPKVATSAGDQIIWGKPGWRESSGMPTLATAAKDSLFHDH